MINSKQRKIKCVIWDLDNTLWDGVLLEDAKVTLRENVISIIKTLDARGILNSIASKNEYDAAMKKLEEFGVAEYFLYPQINWNAKNISIKNIAEALNIGVDSLAFIDDQVYEREEVAYVIPEVICIDANEVDQLLGMPIMNPNFITEDSRLRRSMYLADIKRKDLEENFQGPQQAFLASLEMSFTIAKATESDLQRAEELTMRTNQLNTTGYTYSYDELKAFIDSKDHLLLVASLEDKYGAYGKIGLVLMELQHDTWTVKLLLMSCRVMSRGVGNVLINYILQQAKQYNVKLLSHFITTNKNRMMYMTYKFSGFKELQTDGDLIIFENDLIDVKPFPDYIKVVSDTRLIAD